MPELPDLAILADALDASLAGRPLTDRQVKESLVVRGTPAELDALNGQQLAGVSRRGKFLTFAFEPDRLVVNAMLTGRLGLAAGGSKPWPRASVVLEFGPRQAVRVSEPGRGRAPGRGGSAATERRPADWLREADWLPDPAQPVELRYRDATRMGKLYLLPAGVERPVAGWAEQGPDADDPALTLDEWHRRISRHTGELKNVLRNQAFVAGIGNGYSDEILWAARLAPFRARSSLAEAEIEALYTATREVLAWAIGELRVLVPPRLEVEQREFLRVHRKGGAACPRCGATLSEVSAGGFVTTWCRSCQR
jgi:formamidopyrimidine-DNA glycosylase